MKAEDHQNDRYLFLKQEYLSIMFFLVCLPEVVVGELLQRVGFRSVISFHHDDLRNTNRLLALLGRHGDQCLIVRITSDCIMFCVQHKRQPNTAASVTSQWAIVHIQCMISKLLNRKWEHFVILRCNKNIILWLLCFLLLCVQSQQSSLFFAYPDVWL